MKTLLFGLIRLLPRGFREEHGREIRSDIETYYAGTDQGGILSRLWFTCATATDLIGVAIKERLDPTLRTQQLPNTGNKDMMESLGEWARDIKHAVRSLRRAPGFAAVTIGTLGLAIGANAGMFSVVKRVLLDPLPYAHTERLMAVFASAPGSQFPSEFGAGQEFLIHYGERSRYIEEVAGLATGTSTMRVGDRVERVRMSFNSYNLFTTVGARPFLGRLPVAEDQSRVIVISYAMWKNWFGGDSSVIGKSYAASGAMREVIGVMAPDFAFPADTPPLVWIPNDLSPPSAPGRFGLRLVARTKPGTTPEMLAKELTALSKELPGRFGGNAAFQKVIDQHIAIVRPITEQFLGGNISRSIWVLFASVAIVLLIACANVANLFLVRSEGRQREMAVRQAIGAGRGRLIRVQLAESLVVAAGAAVLAVILARITLPMILRAAPDGIPRLQEVSVNFTTLAFTGAAAILAALACGLIPAMHASSPDLTRLREGGRG